MRRLVLCLVLALTAISGAVPAFAQSEPPQPMQRQGGRPTSGFWGSGLPAKGGAYRYRLMGIGVVLAAATGIMMLHLIKKAKLERDQNNRK